MSSSLLHSTPLGMASVCEMISKVIQSKTLKSQNVRHLQAVENVRKSEKQHFVDEMLQSFDNADKNSDGKLDFLEFLRQQWEGKSDLSYRDSNLRQMRREFRKVDLNKDGIISRDEFIAMAEKCFHQNQEDREKLG